MTYYDRYASKSRIFRIAPDNVNVIDYKTMIDCLLKLDKIVPKLRINNINKLSWNDKFIGDITYNFAKAIEELRPPIVLLSSLIAVSAVIVAYVSTKVTSLNTLISLFVAVGIAAYAAFRFNKQQ